MPLMQVQVGAPAAASLPDGANPGVLGGRQGEAIVSQLHGRSYTQASRGNLFYASNAAAGAAFSIFSNATYVGLGIWNQNPLKNLSIVRANLGFDAQASTAASGWGYAWVNAGYALGTAAPLSAVTAITATRGSCLLGSAGQNNSSAIAFSGATLTTALTWGRCATFSTSTGAITVQMGIQLSEDFDGTMIVPPGFAFFMTSAILTGVTGVGTLIWEEVPV